MCCMVFILPTGSTHTGMGWDSKKCFLMAVWTLFWRRRESLAAWVQVMPRLLSSGTENNPTFILFPRTEPLQPLSATHCFLPVLSTVCSLPGFYSSPEMGRRRKLAFVGEHVKLCAEPHTSIGSSARLCKCFQEQLEEAEYRGRSLARPSAESC